MKKTKEGKVSHNQDGWSTGIVTSSVSNNSINCSFISLTLLPTNLLYSSNIEDKFHRCTLRRHPITVPNEIESKGGGKREEEEKGEGEEEETSFKLQDFFSLQKTHPHDGILNDP